MIDHLKSIDEKIQIETTKKTITSENYVFKGSLVVCPQDSPSWDEFIQAVCEKKPPLTWLSISKWADAKNLTFEELDNYDVILMDLEFLDTDKYEHADVILVRLFEITYTRVFILSLTDIAEEYAQEHKALSPLCWISRLVNLKAQFRIGLATSTFDNILQVVAAAEILGIKIPKDRLSCLQFLRNYSFRMHNEADG